MSHAEARTGAFPPSHVLDRSFFLAFVAVC
jgi:hypothetical protein